MRSLSLRLRIFLFFCLIGFGGMAIVLGAVWLGYRQLGDQQAMSAFSTIAIVSGFGLLALAAFVWRLFDENVSKPIEHLAAQFRIHSAADTKTEIDTCTAQYLGDLAPAATAIHQKLATASHATAETVAQKTARLERQRGQLIRILSDIPIAVIVATQDHQIVLYDGQAATLMEREAPARLNGSVFDYLDEASLRKILSEMEADGTKRRAITISGLSGTTYSGHIRSFEGNAGYTLMLEPLAFDAERPLVYDFDLFEKSGPSPANDKILKDLCFVVFDSETTGLDPAKDDVVQLGAIRVVNGKIIETEVFETLVNPGRPIPPSSTKVHHVSDAMVVEAPPFSKARADFHRFSKGSVLVAHNAPFDMAFLHRDKQAATLHFDNPVLDTVHLSAIVFGGSAEHTLDAICDRLNIEIRPDLRHTALGDAIATAQVLVAMLPILEARGLRSFGEVRAEIQKHSRILKVQE
ncbi:3'-5' exonuclease [Litoreibacter janthinus]|uniref:DNA-directed DNA polymerase n=1 Tax=Litoreibacter janthinus TaxID=670154 RepID=A0A1I6HXV6_9RHOB|nr:3'-5' exonuclease [Litoreibacter janthinus]SFR59257.1 DNA polymerase-3 subunit epsilon [Litoreibacter janthinus]